MIPGIAPTISKKAAAGGGYSFTMTAGNFLNQVFGYIRDLALGEIDQDPIPSHPILAFAYSTNDNIIALAFEGDVMGIVGGLSVWVNGINYTTESNGWMYDDELNATTIVWDGNPMNISDTEEYFTEIR